jgi:hypothetical protein
MMKIAAKWWLANLPRIIGFDGEGEGGTGEGQGTGEGGQGEGQGSTDGEQGEGQGDGEGEGEESGSDGASKGLKTALDRERRDRKILQAKVKAFEKAEKDRADAEKSDVERLTGDKTTLEAKAQKLITGYKTQAIRGAVLEAATKAGFADPTDAMRAEVLDDLGVEQDEEDPSIVEIDEKELARRVKQLLKDKPHYKGAATGDQNQQQQQVRSGSKFGGGNGNQTAEQTAARRAELNRRYPALNGRV